VTTAEKLPAEMLPIPVLEYPHWRVTYRPSTYEENRIATLAECLEVVSKHRVSLRGWDFPHIPPRNDELQFGSRWIAAWSDFMGHLEYWRFYQSTQFLYLGSVREVTEKEWAERLRQTQRVVDQKELSDSQGFLSITNFIYNVTEIFEFAARLAQASVYSEAVEITIRLSGIRGFILVADPDRMWRNAYAASEPVLSYQQTLTPADLVTTAADAAVNCTAWFFERFGWLNPNVAVIRSDQQKLLTGRF
jgi:hypothetical protein